MIGLIVIDQSSHDVVSNVNNLLFLDESFDIRNNNMLEIRIKNHGI